MYFKVADIYTLRLKIGVDTTIGSNRALISALNSLAVSSLFWFVGTFIVLVAFQLGWFSAPTVDRCFIPFIGFLLLGADNHALQRKKVQESAAVWL